jgi:hypothetical protein
MINASERPHGAIAPDQLLRRQRAQLECESLVLARREHVGWETRRVALGFAVSLSRRMPSPPLLLLMVALLLRPQPGASGTSSWSAMRNALQNASRRAKSPPSRRFQLAAGSVKAS